MTLIADLSRPAPRKKRAKPEGGPWPPACSLCEYGHPSCVLCQGYRAPVRVTKPHRAKSEAPELPVRPLGRDGKPVDEAAFGALIALGWVDFAPFDDERHYR